VDEGIIPNQLSPAARGQLSAKAARSRYCPAMRGPAPGSGFLYAAMLAAAAAGRVLDRTAVLPGVQETAAIRGGMSGSLAAIGCALLVAVGASGVWARSRSLRSVAAVVGPGQLVTFFAAEAVVRVANGASPVDADGLVGAGLQVSIALLLLLAMTAAWAVCLRTAPLPLRRQAARGRPGLPGTASFWTRRPPALLLARGPPTGART
jgi:hypothetical protein